jgi:non-specific serine/threonine protein kinase/serine/threonine-protein kinase
MTSAHWQRLKELFSTVSELEAGQRAAFLDRACGDPQLRAELDSLLEANQVPEVVIDQPALRYLAATDAPLLEDHWLGTRIGPYELTALIGRGGMGDVYRARRSDAAFERDVAIKFVRTGLDTAPVLERFRAERRILASLDHPNIARLLDGGTTADGLPYLVMELVAGEPIDGYAAANHLSIASRLRLFLQVCAAVSFAHQRLVIHRDLKPGNILVTAEGTVKLLDFGIAKLLEPDVTAQPRGREATLLALTPAYSSPEQLLGEPLTTASDVYSLGVILFHLLTGQSPYGSAPASTGEAIRAVTAGIPTRPSHIARGPDAGPERIAPDLDDIVLRAMRREPAERYASVDALAEDIERFTSGQPVAAHGAHRSYVLRKLMRRHRVEAASVGVAVLAMAGGLTLSITQAHRARVAQMQAERSLQRARALADSLMFEVHDAIEHLPGSLAARRLLVDRARSYLDDMSRDSAASEALQLDLATAYQRLASIQGDPFVANVGDSAGAEQSLRKAIDLFGRARQRHALPEAMMLSYASALREHSDILVATNGSLPQARQELEQAAGLAQAVHQVDARSTRALEELQQDYGGIAGVLGSNLGVETLSQASAALAYHERQVQAARALVDLDPDNREYRREVMVAEIRIGDTLMQSGHVREAKRRFIAADEELRRLLAGGETHELAENGIAMAQRLGWVYFWEGDSAAGLARQGKGLVMAQRALSQDPNDKHAYESVAIQQANVADGESQLGHWDAARRAAADAVRALGQIASGNSRSLEAQIVLGQGRYVQGLVEYRAGDWAAALPALQGARDLFADQVLRNANNADTRHYWAAATVAVGYAHLRAGHAADAQADFAKALELLKGEQEPSTTDSVRYTLVDAYAGIAVTAAHGPCDAYRHSREVRARILEPGAASPDGFYALSPAVLSGEHLPCTDSDR